MVEISFDKGVYNRFKKLNNMKKKGNRPIVGDKREFARFKNRDDRTVFPYNRKNTLVNRVSKREGIKDYN